MRGRIQLGIRTEVLPVAIVSGRTEAADSERQRNGARSRRPRTRPQVATGTSSPKDQRPRQLRGKERERGAPVHADATGWLNDPGRLACQPPVQAPVRSQSR